jgi:ketosteroid isomerase-like protein
MKKMLFLLGAAALLASCGQEKKDGTPVVASDKSINLDAARTEITNANATFGKSMITGDSAAVASLYHSEAKVFPPNSAAANGKGMGAMSRFIAGMQLSKFDVKTGELTPSGDMIIETGTWAIGVTGKELDKGNYMVAWKQEGSHWKIWRDIWNSENPLPGNSK